MLFIGPRSPPTGETPCCGHNSGQIHDESTVDHGATNAPAKEELSGSAQAIFNTGNQEFWQAQMF